MLETSLPDAYQQATGTVPPLPSSPDYERELLSKRDECMETLKELAAPAAVSHDGVKRLDKERLELTKQLLAEEAKVCSLVLMLATGLRHTINGMFVCS